MEDGVSLSIVNVLQAMLMAYKMWNNVSSFTIINSFERLDSLKITKVDRQLTWIILLKTAPKIIGLN